MPEIIVQHPLLVALREFGAEADERLPGEGIHDQGLARLSLFLERSLEHAVGAPLNTLSFARTCGGTFSFLVEGHSISEDSPVIFSDYTGVGFACVVAHDLHSFLRTGLRAGFMVHTEAHMFAHHGLNPFADLTLDKRAIPVRDLLAERFTLSPLAYSQSELSALQEQFEPFIWYPPNV